MPDWSYQTIFRPLLNRLAPELARDVTLQAFGRLGRLPGGSFVIRTMGHVELPLELQTRIGDLTVKLPVGLSGKIDPSQQAIEALGQIGFGYLEVGPITVEPVQDRKGSIRIHDTGMLRYRYPDANDGIERILARLIGRTCNIPLMFRLCPHAGASPDEALEQLDVLMARSERRAAGYFLDWLRFDWSDEQLLRFADRLRLQSFERGEGQPKMLYVPLDAPDDRLTRLMEAGLLDGWDGVVIGDLALGAEGYETGPGLRSRTIKVLDLMSPFRRTTQTVIATGGVHEPIDALELLERGADIVQLHSGLIDSGPGLPKRVNEAILADRLRTESPPRAPFWRYWGWMFGLGLGMFLGGILAWYVAATSVLLPYDTEFLGIDRTELGQFAPQLLSFMSHDRITLAGTMISIGILYAMISYFGLAARLHWAKTAIVASCSVGFASFFLYLGYGYFDPLHAVAAVVLLPMFLLFLKHRADRALDGPVNLRNHQRWRLAQWGQLCFVALGIALATGGVVIAGVGVTNVFVPQDLDYLCLSPEWIDTLNQRLIPLIAHDRAGFGGALFADAIAILAVALWGIQEGRRWIWWMLLLGGLPGFAAGFGVHAAIGYDDFIHLLPAYVAFVIYATGLVLLFPYLMRSHATYYDKRTTKI